MAAVTTQAEHRKERLKLYDFCAYCGRPKPIPAAIKTAEGKLGFQQDAYCSRQCCEADQRLAAEVDDLTTSALSG